jgi:hypothetical protein
VLAKCYLQRLDSRPFNDAPLHISPRFESDLAAYPIIMVSTKKLLELADTLQTNYLSANGLWDTFADILYFQRAESSQMMLFPAPWVEVRTDKPHCFLSGANGWELSESFESIDLHDLWPNNGQFRIDIKGGEVLLSVIEMLGHDTVSVHVSKNQQSLLENLCGAEEGELNSKISKAANDDPTSAPVLSFPLALFGVSSPRK